MAAMVTTRSQLPSLSFAACPGRVPIDLDGLVATRLLIQANSGAGKSWAVRWLLERTHGRIQQFVLDWEGEFASLRERFAYVPAGQDGDVPADPRTAGLLCRRLLELSASAVLDLSGLQPEDRRRFAQGFLHELMHVPRSLWRPLGSPNGPPTHSCARSASALRASDRASRRVGGTDPARLRKLQVVAGTPGRASDGPGAHIQVLAVNVGVPRGPFLEVAPPAIDVFLQQPVLHNPLWPEASQHPVQVWLRKVGLDQGQHSKFGTIEPRSAEQSPQVATELPISSLVAWHQRLGEGQVDPTGQLTV